ncbi:DUF862-domain-containing protein [Suhomyces tanzawaensis NRRL Y-17324]|uniref:DUF862-domain-containing protein n=1 Tax=Suhomyces tanzawaensis NRRL Y-17324 TaxID=984487 RepID=A0A1E4SPB1_9ASCO|nr:DUF862-domain-containing protein [Suhomyces tanzawaensis NRRL Y-17324]ODV81326.1 DUF862-domain-containing protein [Suhomyces tanzawaensis NRRL Y-17324]
MEDPAYAVKVYVYDLSHGLAAVYSPMVLGTTIEAIYHTSVVVYNKEHYINAGIQVSPPGTTKYGLPIEVIDMGDTFIGPEIFDEFLEELRNHDHNKYHASNYDIFDNNCNHFSNTVVEFLVGRSLDDRIVTLPQKVLATPNGQMLRQMLGNGGAWV